MATFAPVGLFTCDLLNYHHQRLFRIVEECFDVAFILCNSELEEFGIAKVFDIFDQLITTAFVLNTGFWPFFNSIKGQCLCVCGRYGIPCRHLKNAHHWIDLQPIISEELSVKFFPKYIGIVQPTEYKIEIHQHKQDTMGYNIVINLKLQYKKPERGRPRRPEKSKKLQDAKADAKEIYAISINARYNFAKEYYPAFYTIMFQPNPSFHEHYGSYFGNLLEQRSAFVCPPEALNDIQRFFTVAASHMPTTSIVLYDVNLPIHCLTNQVLATFPLIQPLRIKYQRIKRNKATQTNWIVNSPCVEELSTVKSSETRISNWFEEEQSLADCIKKIEFGLDQGEDITAGTSRIDNSVEYDNQMPGIGFDRAVKKYLINREPQKIVDANHLWPASTESVTQDCQANYMNAYTDNTPNEQVKVETTESVAQKDVKTFCDIQRLHKNIRCFPPKVRNKIKEITNDVTQSKDASPCSMDNNFIPSIRNPVKTASNVLSYSEAVKRPLLENKQTVSHKEKELHFKLPTIPKRQKQMTKDEIDEEFELIDEVIKEDILATNNNLKWCEEPTDVEQRGDNFFYDKRQIIRNLTSYSTRTYCNVANNNFLPFSFDLKSFPRLTTENCTYNIAACTLNYSEALKKSVVRQPTSCSVHRISVHAKMSPTLTN